MHIDLEKQPSSPKIMKHAVPLTATSNKQVRESKTTILLNQQSNGQLPESGAASSVASSPFLRASLKDLTEYHLHDVLSQTESPLTVESPRMPAYAPSDRAPQQCAQVQTEAPAHLEGDSSVTDSADTYVNVLSPPQIKEFIDTFRAKTLSSLQKDPLFRNSSKFLPKKAQKPNQNGNKWLPVCPKCAIFFSSFI